MPDIDWTQAEAAAEKLSSWHHLNVRPVAITIGRTTYVGARYNPHDAPDSEWIYLLGEQPPSSRHHSAVYNLPQDNADWYVAGYIDQARISADNKAFHPLGPWFLLARWPHEKFDQRIDAFDERKLRRMSASVLEPEHA